MLSMKLALPQTKSPKVEPETTGNSDKSKMTLQNSKKKGIRPQDGSATTQANPNRQAKTLDSQKSSIPTVKPFDYQTSNTDLPLVFDAPPQARPDAGHPQDPRIDFSSTLVNDVKSTTSIADARSKNDSARVNAQHNPGQNEKYLRQMKESMFTESQTMSLGSPPIINWDRSGNAKGNAGKKSGLYDELKVPGELKLHGESIKSQYTRSPSRQDRGEKHFITVDDLQEEKQHLTKFLRKSPNEKVKSFREIEYPEFLFDENMNLKSGAQELDNYIKYRENSENRTKNSAANPPARIGSTDFIGGANSELFGDQDLALSMLGVLYL